MTQIREVRAKEPNVLLLDAGDQFQGTIWFNYHKGAEAAHFMNRLGYQAMALGNHEFDNGVDGLIKPFLQSVNFPVLSANIKPDAYLAPNITGYYKPYHIFTVGSEKVGVVGYTSKETPLLTSSGPHLIFEDEVEALQREVDKLKTLKIKYIIALGHSGFETDKRIAKEVKGVDIVVGGHTNTFLYTGTPPSNDVPAGKYPYMIKSNDGQNVPVVQAYAYGKYLGYLKVTFDNAGKVTKAEGNPILLDSNIIQDPAILREVNEWKKPLAHYSKEIIGQTLVYLNGTNVECRYRECNMGNLICDAAVYEYIRNPDEMYWNQVTSCIVQGGGIRSAIDERANKGMITLEDLSNVLPFGGTFDMIAIKGSVLKAAFEHSVRRYGGNTGEFLQVSGIHVSFDLSRNPGERVVLLEILCADCRVPHYEPVENQKIYKIVVNSFMAGGGDSFSMLKNENLKHDIGSMDVKVVSNYIKQRGRIYPAVEKRISFTGSGTRISINHINFLLMCVLIFALYFHI
eukprot:gi/632953828/ref/XP_007892636.1/ PREDICTED: 5'-nucleotidase [Callorhinchus milii]